MDEIILTRAKELFGEKRFEEIMGELWLQRERLTARALARGLDAVLREWENRFRRDTEEGRRRVGRNRRERVLRFSELDDSPDASGGPAEDRLAPRIRRTF
jgi:hypothetical protein